MTHEPGVSVHTDYGPDTPAEEYLKLQLAKLEQEYRRHAQPIIDELVKIRARKLPRIVIVKAEPPTGWQP